MVPTAVMYVYYFVYRYTLKGLHSILYYHRHHKIVTSASLPVLRNCYDITRHVNSLTLLQQDKYKHDYFSRSVYIYIHIAMNRT